MEHRMWEDRIMMDREGLTSNHDILEFYTRDVEISHASQSDEALWSESTSKKFYKESDLSAKVSEMKKLEQVAVEFKKTMQVYEETQSSVMSVKEVKLTETSSGETREGPRIGVSEKEVKHKDTFTGGTGKGSGSVMSVKEVKHTETSTGETGKDPEEETGDQNSENCQASGHEYCHNCRSGPFCCVDLASCDPTSDPTSASSSQASSSPPTHSDESDSDVESVISIHLGNKDEQNCAVVEYEFYINDDVENEVDYDSVCNSEDEVEGLVDEECENDDAENDYPSDDEMEYCIDDDDDDYDEEREEKHGTADGAGHLLHRGSGVDRFSHYQEPLEVILEILGEEGEEEEKMEKQTVSSHELSREEYEEDLMTFSNSDEVIPARKKEPQVEKNIVIHEASRCSQVANAFSSFNSSQNDREVLRNSESTQNSSLSDVSIQNTKATNEVQTSTTTKLNSCSSDKLETSQSQMKGEPSDSDKLRCLTSEIETYLRETTRLLESVSSYTKASPSVKKDTGPSQSDILNKDHDNCVWQGSSSGHPKDLIEPKISNVHTSETNQSVPISGHSEYKKSVTHVEHLYSNIQEHLSHITTRSAGGKGSQNESKENCIHASGKSCEEDEALQRLGGETGQPKTHNNMGINDDTSHSYEINEEGNSMKTEQSKISHQASKSDEVSGETVIEETSQEEMKDNWTSCTESQEFFQTLKETRNSMDSRYYSVAEASVDAEDALDWEEKTREKKESQRLSRIVYKPPERSQEDDCYFTSPKNNQEYWETAFEELEGSLISTVDNQAASQSLNVEGQNQEKCTPSSTDPSNPVNSSFETPDYVNIESIKRSSRCESPPPTVTCLDNLEKLYRRMSQEYDLDVLGLSATENSVKDTSKSHQQDVRRETSRTVNKSSSSAASDDYVDAVNQNICSPQTHSKRDVQNLHNTTFTEYEEMTDTVKDNSERNDGHVEKREVCRGKSPGIENAYEARVRENVRQHASSGDTRRFSQRTEIRNKLEEIFRKVEINASLSTCTETIGQFSTYSPTRGSTVPPNTAPKNTVQDDTVSPNTVPEKTILRNRVPEKVPAEEPTNTDQDRCSLSLDDLRAATDVQRKLNEILDGLDVMYERYMAKKRNALHECTTPNNRGSFIELDETSLSSDDSFSLHRQTHKSTTEQSSFKDIIDISEDLKHICVFHVNKPATEPKTTITTPKHNSRNSLSTLDMMTSLCRDGDITEKYHGLGQPHQSSQKTSHGTSFAELDNNGNASGRRKDSISTEGDTVTFLTTMREKNLLCYTAAMQYLELIMTTTSPHEQMCGPASPLSPDTSQSQNMSALQMAAEGRDYLMWCPDQEFDNAVAALDIRGLVELVQTLQDAMAVEQQTFDSLSQQLEVVTDPLQQQRLSAALCTSQTRLARLCSRNMRCFRQQALKVRQKETASSESRSSSPRDSGLTVSSAAASDTEGDPRSPPAGPSFKNSLAFFQRAAHLVANNAKNSSLGARQKETRRRSSRGSSCYGSSSSEAWSVGSDDQGPEFSPNGSGGMDGEGYEDDLALMDDPGTYEQVLFINGRPQYQDDISWSGKRSRSNSWTRVSVDGSTGQGGGGSGGADSQPLSVPPSHPSLPGRSAHSDPPSVSAAEAHTQTQAEDVPSSNVTLPRRKPYLNFKSVSSSSSTSNECDRDNLSLFKERIGIGKYSSALDTLTRAQSFKEGLNCYASDNSYNASGLSRTQSFNDGLASDYNEFGSSSSKAKLQRAPSVDEILESVKYLRAKKTMVKSTPDLASVQEPVYSSASLPRHKSSKSKSSRASGTSSLLGVKYNGHPSNPHYDRVPEPDYEHVPDSGNTAYYENLCKGNNHYENIHLTGEVIYDSPRPTNSHHHYDKVHNDLHYENVKYDVPVYENLEDKEPTYMNVDSGGGKSNIYTNVESSKKTGSLKSLKSRSNKVTVSGNSVLQGATYDVPRAATHIYDSPQKQVRSVPQSSEYDTPKNNRSVLPQSTQIVLKAKQDQKKKIDDIFADCDQDSLEGDRDRGPDIPSPDYGSEEEEDGFEDATNDYVSSEFPDEGLGESDTRSYYTEDPAGLEVILEEPEEEYCSSHASEDDLQREVDITYELKGERRSLDGSEGIGSAEGDTQSSGGSEHYGEEDCASSGIHSEDTPSPGPPVDADKDCGRHPNKQQQQQQQQQKREDDRTQKDRCVEVYPETVRQRQRNMMAAANKVDIKNWNSSGPNNNNSNHTNNNNNDTLTSPSKVKKFLPSVKALRNQFETGKANSVSSRLETNGTATTTNGNGNLSQSRKSSTSNSSLASSNVDNKSNSTNSLHSPSASVENLVGSPADSVKPLVDRDEPVEPIYNQFKKVDEELRELMSKPPSTSGWNPRSLLKRLYYIPEAPRMQSQGTTYVNIEGYLEKLPSGRKKATFWNAWKRRYFVAKEGVLYYYQGNQTEKPSMKMTLMGGRVESMDPNMVGVDDGSRDTKASVMLGIDDGKGHYVVVRCSSRQEAERWRRALETHTVEDFASQYVQPWPMPTNPTLLRDTLVIDIGSASIRAGILASQATLPQLFMPSVVANSREGRRQVWGFDALAPEVRSGSSIAFPIRPSQKISKYSVDLSAVSSLLQKTFAELKVDPKNYHIQLSVPRVLNTNTQAELLRVLFDKHGVRSVNLTHQSILALYAYNATSGIVVDVGERMDIVPVIDGYIVDGGVSRVPYGGYRILDHLRQFLYMRNVSLINEVESYIIRHVLENICYSAHHYNTEKARCTANPDSFEKSVSLKEYFSKDCPYESISLDFGRFQATEGLFNPDAWGLDHPGLHKLVHKAIMECSMDIRKEMSRSIFLAGGVSQLPGLVDRLTTEIDNLTPPAIRPKVHASPYRYHAAYIGACVLAESPAFAQSRITKEDWTKYGNAALRKWSL